MSLITSREKVSHNSKRGKTARLTSTPKAICREDISRSIKSKSAFNFALMDALPAADPTLAAASLNPSHRKLMMAFQVHTLSKEFCCLWNTTRQNNNNRGKIWRGARHGFVSVAFSRSFVVYVANQPTDVWARNSAVVRHMFEPPVGRQVMQGGVNQHALWIHPQGLGNEPRRIVTPYSYGSPIV